MSDSSHADLLERAGLEQTEHEKWAAVLANPAPKTAPAQQTVAEKDATEGMTEWVDRTESLFAWAVVLLCISLTVYFAVQLASIAGYRF